MADESGGENEGIWTAMRRRKVVQWGLAYAAGAWGLLQGVAYLRDTFDWPQQLQQLATIALLIGLPIALTVAWYHGDRGEQRVTRTELAILTLLLLLGGGLFWYYQRTSNAGPDAAATVEESPPAQPASAATVTTDRSIAVLPFVNMSADKEQEYFADGISEELLNLLAQVPELRVIARTSSFSFKGKDVDVATIAKALNVAHVLEGSVRKSGDTIRITAQLVRTSDSSHLWSQAYDRQLIDVFAVQDEIAAAVVEQLKIKLLGEAPKLRETDPRAYAAFLRARASEQQSTQASVEQSIAFYKQALDIDPSYAPAWDGLAAGYYSLADYDLVSGDEVIAPAREAIRKAFASDPLYAPTYARAALIEGALEGDLASAARHLERGLALEPSNLELIGVAIKIARRLGRLDLALDLSEYYAARDPVNTYGYEQLAISYYDVGRLDEAAAACRTGLELNPASANLHGILGDTLLAQGAPRAALAEYEREPVGSVRLSGQTLSYHALGRDAESRAALDEMIAEYGKTTPYYIATTLAYRGEVDRAFEWLDKAVEYRAVGLGLITYEAWLTSLHSDPRWLPLLRRLGKTPEQLAAIKLDVKVPD